MNICSNKIRLEFGSIDDLLTSKKIDEKSACQLYKNLTERYNLLLNSSNSISSLISENSKDKNLCITQTSLSTSIFKDIAIKIHEIPIKEIIYSDSDIKLAPEKKMSDKFDKQSIPKMTKKIYYEENKELSEEDEFQGDFKKKANYMKKMYRQAAYQSFKKFKKGKRDVSSSDDENEDKNTYKMFTTAKKQFIVSQSKTDSLDTTKALNNKSLGARRGPGSKFVPPTLSKESNEPYAPSNLFKQSINKTKIEEGSSSLEQKLKNIEPKIVELIMSEIMDRGPKICWDDIAGLEFVKQTIKEIVVWPMLRPDIFTGLRCPPKGLLLFGPPGTGKTLIGKCIASQSNSTFFSISASSLTSKWVGEGEKMVRALFMIARQNEPSVIFIDEIDSLLSQRSDSEHESSRRIKTEFLVQLDGTFTGDREKLLVVGATNRPHDLDEAARRRFVKRLYIPLPDTPARQQIIQNLLIDQHYTLSPEELQQICQITNGYSGADVTNLCREAALGPIRRLNFSEIQDISSEQVSDIVIEDFMNALKQVRASCSPSELTNFIEWNKKFGSSDLF